MTEELIKAKEALKATRLELLGRANVVATGVGYKITNGEKTPTLSVICSVANKVKATDLSPKDRVPETMDGIPTDVIQTGRFRVFAVRTDRVRPAPGGVSIGHRDITAGTLGCLVNKNGVIHILSNNHVLANSNSASPGDAILQPGPHDGGKYPDDHIANLIDFVAISFSSGGGGGGDTPSGCSLANGVANVLNGIASMMGSDARLKAISTQATDNLVDAAIARPLNDSDVSEEILEIGTIAGTASGELDMAVKKSGRTTEFTTGVIEQVDVTVDVEYGTGRTARFTDQLVAGPMSQGGDSGSAVLDTNNRLIGLLFAGSDQNTIINRIENVFSALDISL
jgi:hypothetical protein